MRGLHRIVWFIPIGILLLSAGCETSLDLQTNPSPKLTIISQVTPNALAKNKRVYVFASQSPSDSSQFYTPQDLEVLITESGTGITIPLAMAEESGKKYFKIPDGFIKAGFQYTVIAQAPGFENVQATTTIPSPSTLAELSIKTISIEPSELNEFKKNIRYTLQFKIDHKPGNQYYHLIFYNDYEGLVGPLFVNPELSDNQPFIHHYEFGVLMERKDVGDDQLLAFNFVDWTVEGHDLTRVYVELRSVTEEYYKYHTSLARQLIGRQDPFAEPVTIYNNIKGGYGNFSGFATSTTSSDLPK
ncbi:MAG: DUF4249 domain-containing protein [Saprospiraceae bacterium]